MDKIGSILEGIQQPNQVPPEIKIIKSFVQDEYQEDCSVTVRQHDITILVSNGGLASQLQLRLPEISERCASDKRLRIHIGS